MTADGAAVGVAVVVPSFHPDRGLVARLPAVRAQAELVIIADDGSGPRAESVLRELEAEGDIVARLPENRGIAAALNAGIELAVQRGAAWVLTVDQDSLVDVNYVEEALVALARAGDASGSSTAVVAGTVDGGVPAAATTIRRPDGAWELLQSGLFVSTAVLESVGGFEEALFIDCVDTEWGLRARDAGVDFLLADRCVLDHGAGVPVRWALPVVGEVEFSVHTPLRRFYITRNRAVISVRFLSRRPRWFLAQARAQAQIALLGVLHGPSRRRQALAIALGLVAAVAGRRGRASGVIDRLLVARPPRV